MVLTSTTHIAMMNYLDNISAISAVLDPNFIYNEQVKKAIADNKIEVAGGVLPLMIPIPH